ncbi:hypothetical protein SBADM41S_02139 [Streptomyces badius]
MPAAPPAAPDATADVVLVVDFGAQYAQLIARRVREARVYSEIVPSTMPVAEMLAKHPRDHPLRRPVVGVRGGRAVPGPLAVRGRRPVFGMCYGFQLMATTLGGTVDDNGAREYGRTPLHVTKAGSTLFEGTPTEQPVWMSHGDACSAAPEGFTVTASTDVVPVAAFENDEKKLYGVQYHPEVMHSTHGQQVLEHFLYRGAGIEPNWTTTNVVEGLRPGARIVDLGSGWGELLMRLVESAPGATGDGVETDPAAVARGRKLAEERGLAERVRFHETPAAQWPDGGYDLAVSIGSSHAWPGTTREALTALAATVRPGGRVLFGEAVWLKEPTPAALEGIGAGPGTSGRCWS